MPELPEVETVRRGLAPAMEGARFERVEVRHRGLRWPIVKDFEKRLTGATVLGLGRRAKYLVADLSTGDVLIMHLGMSGSFRIGRQTFPAISTTSVPNSPRTTTSCFTCRTATSITFNDPRRFGSMKLVPRAKLEDEPQFKRARARAARQ